MHCRAVTPVASYYIAAVITVILAPELNGDESRFQRLDIREFYAVGGFPSGVKSHAREARDVRGVEGNFDSVHYLRRTVTNAHPQGLHLPIPEPGRVGDRYVERSARCVGASLALSEDAQ